MNPYYPRIIKCLDGAERTVSNAQQHAIFTGIPRNEDGTEATAAVEESQSDAPETIVKRRRGRPPANQAIAIDPLAAPEGPPNVDLA